VLSDRDAQQGLWVLEKLDFGKNPKPEGQPDPVGKVSFLVVGDVWWGMGADSDGGSVRPHRAKLDPNKNPKWLDLTFVRPDNAHTETPQYIYELDGDKLRICMCSSKPARPAEFSSDTPELVAMHFRRAKLPPAAGEKALLGSWAGEPVETGGGPEKPGRTVGPRVEVLDGYLFVHPGSDHDDWIGGRYTVNTTKNPKWVDVELVAPFGDDKATKLYGCYEVAEGRLKLALGTKRATRPLEFGGGRDIIVFDVKRKQETICKPEGGPAPRANGTAPNRP
jgi:uncharacterized protein (TIGR03067 family)